MFGSDSDDGFLFLLPWWIWLPLMIIGGAIYACTPESSFQEMCGTEAGKLKMEWKYDHELDGKGMGSCLVKIDPTHWQKIEKYKKSGIINN